MKILKQPFQFVLCILVMSAMSIAWTVEAAPMLIYSETFNTDDSVNAPLDNVGWQAHRTTSATAYDTSSNNTSTAPIIGSLASGGGDDSGNGTGFGYLFNSITASANPTIYWTAPAGGLGDIANLDHIEVDLRNSSSSEDIRLALEIGGSWFVAEPPGVNNPSGTTWLDDIVLDPDLITWRDLNFTPGTTLTVPSATSVALPSSGTLNAIGFYDGTRANSTRIDNVEVFANQIPEPSSIALWALMGIIGFGFALRRKRRWAN